jgi:hypothetical protein
VGDGAFLKKNNRLAKTGFAQCESGNPWYDRELPPIDRAAFARSRAAPVHCIENDTTIRRQRPGRRHARRGGRFDALSDQNRRPAMPDEPWFEAAVPASRPGPAWNVDAKLTGHTK